MSYPDVPVKRDRQCMEVVQQMFEAEEPYFTFSLMDLVAKTGLSAPEVNRGLHYYRNFLATLRAIGEGGEYAIVCRGGQYWRTDNEGEIRKYHELMTRRARTHIKTGLHQVRVLARPGDRSASAKRARTVIKSGDRLIEDMTDMLTELE